MHRILLLAISFSLFSATASADSKRIETGRALYDDKCAQCHGAEGDGMGSAADRLMPRPRDFTSGSFKIRTTPSGELPVDSDLASIIRQGMPYSAMPAWPQFSDEEIAALVEYVKSFNEDFSDPEMIVPPIEIPAPPPLSEESVEKGRGVYIESKCFDCHGDVGRADGESAPTLKTDAGDAIRPADLTKRWSFRGGSRREDIYRTFTTGLDGTPMPSYADSVGEEERWQLVDYVYSLSEDEPDYGTLLTAIPAAGEIELNPTSPLFDDAPMTRLPVVGQVTDPGRAFAPATQDVELRAVYDADLLALQVSWHAMLEGREGSNRPDGRDPLPGDALLSDAVGIQIPSELLEGTAKPYFLYGDPEKSVDLFFYDAAKDAASTYLGKGEANLIPRPESGDSVRAKGEFQDGLWRVVFLIPRQRADENAEPRLPEATFLPIALSVWAGHAEESGNRRGITSWYHLYLEPPDTGAAYKSAGAMALSTLALELLIVASVRRSQRNRARQS